MNVIKSIVAVIAGFLAIVLLTSMVDALLAGIGIFPDKPEEYTTGLSLIALVSVPVLPLWAVLSLGNCHQVIQ